MEGGSFHLPMVDISKPEACDVLSGRGVSTNRHPGNIRFRSLVALNKVGAHSFLRLNYC